MSQSNLKSFAYRLQDKLYQYTGCDRRVQFDSMPTSDSRETPSDIIQFYSSYDNIGNYLPVLGIHEMLDREPDVCCAHRNDIDFDYINKEYKCAIIGGAGLLHKSFEQFWLSVRDSCNIPIIVWGVGACLPDDNPEVADRNAVNDVFQRAKLVNVRDTLTTSIYESDDISVSACPTVVFLDKFKDQFGGGENVLVSWHKELVSREGNKKIVDYVESYSGHNVFLTDNIQRPSEGLIDIIEKYYLESDLVVTSRLHGAIIAYSLGIPYISIARDDKVRSFVGDYGNGRIVESMSELKGAYLYENTSNYLSNEIEIRDVLKFGHKASEYIDSICG